MKVRKFASLINRRLPWRNSDQRICENEAINAIPFPADYRFADEQIFYRNVIFYVSQIKYSDYKKYLDVFSFSDETFFFFQVLRLAFLLQNLCIYTVKLI